ncbi:MAG: DUF554 domain-containing protein [Candidatus Infernicultor aquiphilus]|uniref:DUF554 domain-containing protein n=2 Tax=Candidatus Infernicultor aquiphilus TaxID=1805029 RepID=A0A2M8C9B8_9BACT|nr:DUF554 domain-containing protein [bacterium]PIU25498.1 MAG: DUF554 domain-containing protein [Candidatus Atribacteria bacterium CG08_land_8_20_14_0_20_33_29]PIW12420.1 MAG: DUF554 domain-containing protein [Candidatus Atribacteria bacterium CG17_big_fil_post_rev_8_21_14_2_50_34_11]PIX34682.1 MAG: DUF554 domain-containing protein [Candidatus Atribacteria bacterium CG_4_8_14_3_um_filter_34_18]PIY31504.1 MAG: DUF554 domain-containing protein [Candidatus Atribacteria bacterium CG_4_10_14_3_um_fi
MKGTIVNVVAIFLGCSVGLILKSKFPEKIEKIIMQALGLASLLIGMQMAIKADNILLVIFSLVIGGVIGEIIDIEAGLERFGERIKRKFKSNNTSERFVEGFLTASLLYCVGSMAIMGAIKEGLSGNPDILYAKSLLDGVTSIAFTAAMGIGVLFSAIPVFLYQGGITLLSRTIKDFLSPEIINEMTAVGGILIWGIGFGLLGIKKIKVGNLLPAILVAAFLAAIFS